MDKVELAWKGRTMIRWYCTQWCNYACSYCHQDHSRKQVYRGAPGHWVDNRPMEDWVEALNRVPRLALTITGGEPMLDRKPMKALLENLRCDVKIETNVSWKPWPAPDCSPWLQVSYHPDETSMGEFFPQLFAIREAGWRVATVNVVAMSGNFDFLWEMHDRCLKGGFLLHVITWDGRMDTYTEEERAALRRWVPDPYLPAKSGVSPEGQLCLHPAIAYRMYPDGFIEGACHESLTGSIFGELPERPMGYVPCPRAACSCSDKFTFLKSIGTNVSALPILDYAEGVRRALRKRD